MKTFITFAHPQLHLISRATCQSTIPASLYPFRVIRVSVSAMASLQPLIKANAELIERHAIGVKTVRSRGRTPKQVAREV